MSFNSSTLSDISFNNCTDVSDPQYINITMAALRTILLLPLSIFVLYLGHQRWQKQRSSKIATHSDIFTYHMAGMQLIWILMTFFLFVGTYSNQSVLVTVGASGSSIIYYGETVFHVLTCVERYLAVVHPITYMGLKNARGVKIRKICIAGVWLLYVVMMCFTAVTYPDTTVIPMLCLLIFSTTVISFCSLSALCVLIRPGPGEGGGDKQRVDQSKQRAFYTITAISVTVWLWFVGLLVCAAGKMSPQLKNSINCLAMMVLGWLNLPSSLVSPLLYLHRTEKLSQCC